MRRRRTLEANLSPGGLLVVGLVMVSPVMACEEHLDAERGTRGNGGVVQTLPGEDRTPNLISYLGGSAFEQTRDLVMDGSGNTYIVGGTRSPDFPVTAGAYQTTHNPGTPEDGQVEDFDAFVTKLDPSGAIVWSTYLGGPNYERAYAVEVDAQGYVYVAGRAGAGFPVTAGAFQTQFQGGEEAGSYGQQDGFVCKLEPDGSALVFCSYFGSTDPRPVRDVAVDGSGNLYLASGHLSGSYPASVSSQFINARAGGEDAVLAKISADGSTVLWARHLGGGADEHHENSVRIGADGNPYILFTTYSAGQATAGAFNTTYGGSGDLFVAQVSSGDGSLLWGGYLGGSGFEETETHELGVDSAGNPVVAFQTRSTDVPTTSGAFRRTASGGLDIVVARISADGTTLEGATYVGGSQDDETQGVGVDRDGNIYFAGTTGSSDYPVTAGAFRDTYQGGSMDLVAVGVAADFASLVYSSYLGGSAIEVARSAFVNGAGTLWVTGETNSTDWPTLNAPQPAFAGGNADAIIVRLQP